MTGVQTCALPIFTPNFHGFFSKKLPSKKLEEEYKKKKMSFMNQYIKDIKDTMYGFYTLAKASAILGYNIKTLHRWIKDDKIKAKKYGGRWYIPKDEIERLVEELEGSAPK